MTIDQNCVLHQATQQRQSRKISGCCINPIKKPKIERIVNIHLPLQSQRTTKYRPNTTIEQLEKNGAWSD